MHMTTASTEETRSGALSTLARLTPTSDSQPRPRPHADRTPTSYALNEVILGLLTALVLTGCATTSTIVQGIPAANDNAAQTVHIHGSTRILALTAKVLEEDALTEAQISSDRTLPLAKAMDEQAILAFRANGFEQASSVDRAGLSDNQKSVAQRASASANRLTRAHPDPAALQLVRELGTPGQPVVVLAQFLRVKRGPSGTWDPNSGAITSNGSSSQFRATLLDCQTGRVLWQNSVELRKVPVVDSGDFKKAMSLLYSTIITAQQITSDTL